MRKTTRASARDVDESDGTSLEPSNISEDTLVSPAFRDLDPIVDIVEGNTVDWTVDVAIPLYQEAILHWMFKQAT
jgi:hypothetical protein